MSAAFLPPQVLPAHAHRVRARVLYADTDKMGIVYHAAYLRYLELARGELLRAEGLTYRDMERSGSALPLTDLALHYVAPALYDDVMTIEVAVTELTSVRVGFGYRVTVLVGDRAEYDRDVRILTAATRHACVRVATGRPERLPEAVFEALRAKL